MVEVGFIKYRVLNIYWFILMLFLIIMFYLRIIRINVKYVLGLFWVVGIYDFFMFD